MMEWLLTNDIESILHNNECPLNYDSKARVFEIEKLFGGPRIVPCSELIEMVPC
jgi:hypothetical protein